MQKATVIKTIHINGTMSKLAIRETVETPPNTRIVIGRVHIVADKLINDEVKMIDYVQIEETVGTDVRLVFEKSTVNNAIISFTAFGSK